MNLQTVSPGTWVRVVNVNGTDVLRQRLFDMGLMPNIKLMFQRIAPLGYPVWIRFEGTQMSLRKDEAASVEVEPINPAEG